MKKLLLVYKKFVPFLSIKIYHYICILKFILIKKTTNKSQSANLKLKEKLKSNGLIIHFEKEIKEFIESDEFKFVIDSLDFAKSNDINPSVYYLEGNQKLFKYCKKIISPVISDVLKDHFKSDFQILRFDLLRSEPNPNYSREGSWLWHMDNYHRKSFIKLFCYLNDVKRENGAFQCIPKKYTNHFIRKGFDHNERRSKNDPKIIREIEKKLSPVEGKKGTTFICNTSDVIHRASLPKVGKRELIVFEIAPSFLNSKRYDIQSNVSNNIYYKFLKEGRIFK